MRRSICYCEPNQALAGEVNTWKFIYTPSVHLPKGAKLKFELDSLGRHTDWEIPSTNLKKTSNVIYAELENNKIIPAVELKSKGTKPSSFEFVLPAKLEAGGVLAIVIGSPKSPDKGTRAQVNAQRRRIFSLYVDPKGKGVYEDPEIFSLDVRGNELSSIRVIAPSFVIKNKRFDVIVRFEDKYGNLTNQAPIDTLVELSHEHLRENLNWKLFVPETGFIALPNLYFNEKGIYTIKLRNPETKSVFKSPPIVCFDETTKHLFWGLLHGESERIDATENIENCLRYFRDDFACNFYAISPFENQEETSNEIWKFVCQYVADFDEADRFTTLTGFQWVGTPGAEGIRQIIYAKDAKQLMRKKDPKYQSLKNIYKNFSPKEMLSIPCWTMAKGYEYDFKDFDPNFERVVEIYNSWGSSECTKKEGNQLSISSSGKEGISETAEGSIQKALLRNLRFGFVAGGLDDRGVYQGLYEGNQLQYPPGLTAIAAVEHNRHSLIDALYNRHCYATTGERMIVGFNLADAMMGDEIHTGTKQGLKINRHLCGYVAGTATITKVEIIRNGKVIETLESKEYWLNFTYDDMTPLEKIVVNAKDGKPPFVYYYIRVTQEDGHMAWSSPIWVDLVPPAPIVKPHKSESTKSSPVKAAVTVLDEEDEIDEEDEDLF